MKSESIKKLFTFFLVFTTTFLFSAPSPAYAATTPALGQAASFGILSSTYTNTASGTVISSDLGYTTGPATAPTVNGTTYSPPSSKYSSAGIDQGAALAALASQACTHTFPAGAVDLATDTSHGTIGIYAPGVYCTAASSAASIGAGGITLSGSGSYIFRITGALTTVANSTVTLAGGASACDVFWTPTGATTLGANSIFFGTDIDDAGITIGSTITWVGRALAFGGTVSTTTDTITVPSCTGASNAAGTTTSTSTSSSSSSSTTTSSCPAVVPPSNNPNLFQIDRAGSKAVLHFSPVSDNLTYYYIAYGLNPTDEQFAVSFPASLSKGAVTFTINDLNPNTTYYFKVRGGNGCAPGGWSNVRATNSKSPMLPNTGMGPQISCSL